MTTKTNKIKTSITALALLAVAALMPACDILNPNPCNPDEEICVFTGNHPSGLDPAGTPD